MTDPLETLLVNAEWHAIELKHDRGGDYLQEAEAGNGITLAELVKRYNALLRAPAATVTGWRLLEVGEATREGDELLGWDRTWNSISEWAGVPVTTEIIRRRLPAPPVDAVTAVVEAGMPFVYLELPLHPDMDDDEPIHLTVTVGELRALRSALAALAAKELR